MKLGLSSREHLSELLSAAEREMGQITVEAGSQTASTNSWHCCCWQLTSLSSPAAQRMSLSTVGHTLSNWTSATFSHSKIDWKKRSCLAWERSVSCQQQQCQLLVLAVWLPGHIHALTSSSALRRQVRPEIQILQSTVDHHRLPTYSSVFRVR